MYLKPTQALWNQVDNKINSMFVERINYASNWLNYGMKKDEFDLLCLRAVISAEEDFIVQQLADNWFNTEENIHVEIHNGKHNETYTLPASTGGRKPYVSPRWNQYGSNKPRVKDEKIREIAMRRREAINVITKERDDFKAMVKKAWDGAPSLNALAKIWPPIVDLLPNETVQKLNEKAERRSAAAMEENVDTKALSVHILKAKVAR
jgi:hypothetical protein